MTQLLKYLSLGREIYVVGCSKALFSIGVGYKRRYVNEHCGLSRL
jgi:hypothetical protein